MILGSMIGIIGIVGFAIETGRYREKGSLDSFGLLLATLFLAVGGCLFYFGRLARIRKRRAIDMASSMDRSENRIDALQINLESGGDKSEGVLFKRQDYGTLFRRFLVIVVDGFVLAVIATFLAVLWTFWSETPDFDFLFRFGWTFMVFDSPIYFGTCSAIFYVYLVLLKPSKIRTLGYRLADLKVVNLQGNKPSIVQMTFRFILLLFGPIHIIMDLFWVGNDEYRQTLRDKFVSTLVVRNDSIPESLGRIVHTNYQFMGLFLTFREVKGETPEVLTQQKNGADR